MDVAVAHHAGVVARRQDQRVLAGDAGPQRVRGPRRRSPRRRRRAARRSPTTGTTRTTAAGSGRRTSAGRADVHVGDHRPDLDPVDAARPDRSARRRRPPARRARTTSSRTGAGTRTPCAREHSGEPQRLLGRGARPADAQHDPSPAANVPFIPRRSSSGAGNPQCRAAASAARHRRPRPAPAAGPRTAARRSCRPRHVTNSSGRSGLAAGVETSGGVELVLHPGVERAPTAGSGAGRGGASPWTMPTPSSATNVPVSAPSADGATLRAAGRQRRRAVDRRQPVADACAATSSGWPSSSAHTVEPSHSTDGRAVQRAEQRPRIGGRRREPLRRRRARPGAQDHLAEEAERALRADQQAAESKPLTFFTVGPPALTTSPAADT